MGLTKKEKLKRKSNKLKAINYAKVLRKKATLPEKILNERLKEEKVIFYFQHPFAGVNYHFIVDFYFKNIDNKKYVIEVDGRYHEKRKRYDKKRSFILYHKLSCCVIRFKNKEVLTDADSVVDKIMRLNPKIKQRT